jgi:hypothetical protein
VQATNDGAWSAVLSLGWLDLAYIVCTRNVWHVKMERKKTKKLGDGELLQWLTRDRYDLSPERAPHRDKTANFRQN